MMNKADALAEIGRIKRVLENIAKNPELVDHLPSLDQATAWLGNVINPQRGWVERIGFERQGRSL